MHILFTRPLEDCYEMILKFESLGHEISHLPLINIEGLKYKLPNYSEFKGWDEDLTKMTSEDQLPKNLLDYVAFVERETGVPVKIVSVGPDRKQTILR